MLTEAFRQYSEKVTFSPQLKRIKSRVQFQDAYHLHTVIFSYHIISHLKE